MPANEITTQLTQFPSLLSHSYDKKGSRVSRVSRVILLTLLHLKMSKNIPKPSKNGPKRFKTAQSDPKRLKMLDFFFTTSTLWRRRHGGGTAAAACYATLLRYSATYFIVCIKGKAHGAGSVIACPFDY